MFLDDVLALSTEVEQSGLLEDPGFCRLAEQVAALFFSQPHIAEGITPEAHRMMLSLALGAAWGRRNTEVEALSRLCAKQ